MAEDLSGQTFSHLTALKRVENYVFPNGKPRAQWLCRCVCGNTRKVRAMNLKAGQITSCGCKEYENRSKAYTKHGLNKTKVHRIWSGMKSRCSNPRATDYKYYGALGITVCERWRESFEDFLSDMAHPPTDNHTIERKNVRGNYEPGNCCWIPSGEQARNKRRSIVVEVGGKKMCLAQASKEIGINYHTVISRIGRGKTPQEAIS